VTTVSRHAAPVDGHARSTRLAVLAVVWVCGLVAGFFGLLGAAARYGCSARDQGLACGNTGTFFGVLVIIAVIAVVTLVTVLTYGRRPRQLLLIGGLGMVGIALCYLAARGLLQTV
jgi:hypothetical protein